MNKFKAQTPIDDHPAGAVDAVSSGWVLLTHSSITYKDDNGDEYYYDLQDRMIRVERIIDAYQEGEWLKVRVASVDAGDEDVADTFTLRNVKIRTLLHKLENLPGISL